MAKTPRVSAADLMGDLGEQPESTIQIGQSATVRAIERFDLMDDLAAETLSPEEQIARCVRKELGVRYIPLSSGRRIKFTTIYIPAGQVEELTLVHPANTRNPKSVTVESCEDIYPSISNDGVMLDAFATRNASGAYEVFNGQRRRFCAIHAKKGLPVSYTLETLSTPEIKEVSHIANLTKPNSLHDKGCYYMEQMSELRMTQAEYADYTGTSTTQINYGLAAAKIPLFIYELFPSFTDIGRPTILSVSRQYHQLTETQKGMLRESCADAMQKQQPATDSAAASLIRDLFADLNGKDKPADQPMSVSGFTIKTKHNGKLEVTLPKGMDVGRFMELLKKIPPKS
jgi:ParB family transcriptional regulator, chromosome partitioning protein